MNSTISVLRLPVADFGRKEVRACLRGLCCASLAMALVSCGTLPVARTDGHLKNETQIETAAAAGGLRATTSVPQPVRQVPLPPPPAPRIEKIKYSVTVDKVSARELLFAISRDTKVNIDVYPGIEGNITLNAIDQTLEQILTRISKQILIRWEVDGPNIVVRPDTPYLKLYTVNYINMSRESSGTIGVQTQVVGPSGTGTTAGGTGGQNSSLLKLDNKVTNDFWKTLEKNIRDILLEEDKYVDRVRKVNQSQQNAAQASQNTVQASGTGEAGNTINSGVIGAASGGKGNQSVQGAAGAAQTADAQSVSSLQDVREANPVIVNRETGTISIRANSRIHDKINGFINSLIGSSSRQVLIEATVVEVVLNDAYQSGVDWAALGLQGLGYTIRQNFSAGLQPVPSTTPFFSLSYRNPNAAAGGDISSTIKLLSSFGNTRVLSSPKIMTLNNQTAVMRVVENQIYFTLTSTPATLGANGQILSPATYTTTPNVVPEGFVMNVTPQISENDIVNLNIRPSVTRITSYVNDPNPDLKRADVVSRIPVIQTREFETMMRVASGQTAVLGGLMQDSFQASRDGLPVLARVPVLGDAVSYRNDSGRKSELVVFIRALVIREASVDADLADYKKYLPGANFFKDASPSFDPNNPGLPLNTNPLVPESESRKAP